MDRRGGDIAFARFLVTTHEPLPEQRTTTPPIEDILDAAAPVLADLRSRPRDNAQLWRAIMAAERSSDRASLVAMQMILAEAGRALAERHWPKFPERSTAPGKKQGLGFLA